MDDDLTHLPTIELKRREDMVNRMIRDIETELGRIEAIVRVEQESGKENRNPNKPPMTSAEVISMRDRTIELEDDLEDSMNFLTRIEDEKIRRSYQDEDEKQGGGLVMPINYNHSSIPFF